MKARVFLGVIAAIAIAPPVTAQTKAPSTQSKPQVPAGGKLGPKFTVDYQWPKPLPTHKLLGSVLGVAVDKSDHVFVVHRIDSFTARTETGADANPPIAECCWSEMPVIEFDAAGNRVKSWGGPGPGYDWPAQPAGIAVAPNGNVWIGGTGGLDAHILVFSHDGQFIKQIGKPGQAPAAAAPAAPDTAYQGVSPGARGAAAAGTAGGRGGAAAAGGGGGGRGGRGGRGAAPVMPPNSSSMDSFGGAMRISFTADGNTAYIADGTRNRRVVIMDANTYAFTKIFGANGNDPSDAATPAYSPDAAPSASFSQVACAEPSKDGLVYVCDQKNDRIQVFKGPGGYWKEVKVAPATLQEGSVCDIALSADAAQRFLYVADCGNHKVRVLDRVTLTELFNFGTGGRIPGMFDSPSSIAVDSKGNVYTGENYEGKRVQKFVFGGLAPITKTEQGVLWPTRAAK